MHGNGDPLQTGFERNVVPLRTLLDGRVSQATSFVPPRAKVCIPTSGDYRSSELWRWSLPPRRVVNHRKMIANSTNEGLGNSLVGETGYYSSSAPVSATSKDLIALFKQRLRSSQYSVPKSQNQKYDVIRTTVGKVNAPMGAKISPVGIWRIWRH